MLMLNILIKRKVFNMKRGDKVLIKECPIKKYVGIEGGGGYYHANPGGYDVLGLGTLMYAQ